MKGTYNNVRSIALISACLVSAVMFSSCDDGTYDHVPPEGNGSIIVENNSGNDTGVYIDGTLMGTARSRKATVFDIIPGTYRVVLDEDDGYRNYSDFVDVLDGRLTVLDVMIDYSSSSEYYVIIDFQ